MPCLPRLRKKYEEASAALVAVTPSAMTANLKAATAKEVAKVEAAGGTPSAFLAEVDTAANAITVEPVVIVDFTDDAMSDVEEVVETVEADPTPLPTEEPDDDIVPGGAAAMVTSSKVAVSVAGVVAVVAAYA